MATNMCRVTRTSRTYNNPSEVTPAGPIIQQGEMFISCDQVDNGSVRLFKITQAMENENIPLDAWIPDDVLDYAPIEDETILKDQPIDCNETLVITGTKITVYETAYSSTPITTTLGNGDSLTVDKSIDVTMGDSIETRYRITAVNGDTNHPAVGKWIVGNTSIQVGGNIVRFQGGTVMQPRMYAARAAMDQAAVDGGGGGGTTTTDSGSSHSSGTIPGGDGTSTSEGITVTSDNAGDIDQIALKNTSDYNELYSQYGMNYELATKSTMNVPIGRMIFVHGMPFQYTYLTDRRTGATGSYGSANQDTSKHKSGTVDEYGRTFALNIAANMPIATIVPGVPKFLTNVKQGIIGYAGQDSAKNNWAPLWADLNDSELSSAIENMVSGSNGEYQYYTMEINLNDYFHYVNALCQTSAQLMGLGNIKLYKGAKCDKFNWYDYNKAADQDYNIFEEVVGLSGGVAVAFDPMSSISDSITNSTGESEFAGMFKSLAGKARELEFMTGSAGVNLDLVNSEDFDVSTFSAGGDGLLAGISSPLSRIKSFLVNASHGMNVRFPQIWSDSQSSKSYDIDMKFIAPYATPFCKWRYVLVPFFHLFCLAAPRSPESLSSYQRPFLIRAYSKGYFNVEMGIIESIQWKRFGEGDMISEDGIPTEIDVSISFADLYQQLAMSKKTTPTEIGIFFNNTGLMDMLGTLSGVNMNRIGLGERLSLYTSSAVGAFSAIGSNFMAHISDRVRNVAQSYLMGT